MAEDGGDDFAPGLAQAAVGRGHVGFDEFVQFGQGVIGHQRKHVVLDVVVHVPIQVAVDRVHVDRAAIEAVVEHVFGEPGMLGIAIDRHQPGTIEIFQGPVHS